MNSLQSGQILIWLGQNFRLSRYLCKSFDRIAEILQGGLAFKKEQSDHNFKPESYTFSITNKRWNKRVSCHTWFGPASWSHWLIWQPYITSGPAAESTDQVVHLLGGLLAGIALGRSLASRLWGRRLHEHRSSPEICRVWPWGIFRNLADVFSKKWLQNIWVYLVVSVVPQTGQSKQLAHRFFFRRASAEKQSL